MKSIKFKMWISMMAVVTVLITVIWLLFAIFLQNFYEFAKEGEVSEYRIDFTEFFGELPKGKYRLVLGFVEPEESGKYKNIGYTKIDFEIK